MAELQRPSEEILSRWWKIASIITMAAGFAILIPQPRGRMKSGPSVL